MRLQLLSDLHLESETFQPRPAAGADLLLLGGDVDSTWRGLSRFAGWPVPVVVVAGNHEHDLRDVDDTLTALRVHCHSLGFTLLERDVLRLPDGQGRAVHLIGTTRWSDFDLFGPARRAKCERAATYFAKVMRARRGGSVFDAPAVRAESLACRAWLAEVIARTRAQAGPRDAIVVVTHFAPSLRSLDPRYGEQPTTASFCNDDEALMPGVDCWLHGHLHCRHDYAVTHADGTSTRVLCQARGLERRGEAEGFDAMRLIQV